MLRPKRTRNSSNKCPVGAHLLPKRLHAGRDPNETRRSPLVDTSLPYYASGQPHPITDKPQYKAAHEYCKRGWAVGPLCWPAPDGICGCGNPAHKAKPGESPKPGGKAPLQPRGVKDFSKQLRDSWHAWSRWPDANIGIDLERSELFVIAPDSVEWHEKFQKLGLPPTRTARSGGGEGHLHYYYRRPESCPIFRINKSPCLQCLSFIV